MTSPLPVVETPLLSVIVPSFNCGSWLERSVASTRHLGAIPMEVLVIDDGSTDNTRDVVRGLEASYPDLIYLYKPNGGLSSARNHGLAHARGTYIMLLDADDELIPCDLVPIIERGHDVVRLGVEEVTLDVGSATHVEHDESAKSGYDYLGQRFAAKTFYTPSWAYLYRRAWLEEQSLQFVQGLIHEDNLFTVQALLAARSVSTTDQLVYRYFRRPNSITTSRDDAKRIKRISSLQFIADELVRIANSRQDIDMRYWIEQVIDYAYSIALRSTWRSCKFKVILMQLQYMLRYASVGGRRYRWKDRRRLRNFLVSWVSNHQAAGESW